MRIKKPASSNSKYQPYPHQIELSEQGSKILKDKGLVYLAMQERVGKTLTSLLICEKTKAKKIFIITKKAVVENWVKEVQMFANLLEKDYYIANYEAIHKWTDEVKNADLVIVDEAHYALSRYPKPSKTAKLIQSLVYNKPVIFLSATPSSQSYSQLFHQLNITKYSPFNGFRNFYEWYREFGLPETKYLAGRSIIDYTNVNKKRLFDFYNLDSYFISKSRSEIGFEHEPTDKIVFVDLNENTNALLKQLKASGIVEVKGQKIICDTAAKRFSALHQIEGGTILNDGVALETGETEKIEWVLENYGDTEKIAIFYNFKAEKVLLSRYFKQAKLLQSTSHAEGIDLHEMDKVIIYSMNYSAAKYTQRRARQCNMKRSKPIEVIFLLAKEGLSKYVYERVAVEKKSFTASYYEKLRKEGNDI